MHSALRSLRALGLVSLLAVALPGCVTHYLPNTDLEDTEENRKITAFAEKYRHAVERLDVDTLLKLAAPNYYEDGGNLDAADDLDRAGLEAYLTSKFRDARAVRYEMRYRAIRLAEDRVLLDYTYTASYKIVDAKGAEVWRRKVEDNRLELIPNQDEYLVVRGM